MYMNWLIGKGTSEEAEMSWLTMSVSGFADYIKKIFYFASSALLTLLGGYAPFICQIQKGFIYTWNVFL
jgi:hypothetical protein